MQGSGRRALVVDDTAILRVIVCRILRTAQFDVVEAANGAEAIQAFFDYKPDVVLLDLNMDGIDGADALRGILQINANARIVVCSAMSDAHTVTNVLKLGAKGYVTKPFTAEKLLGAIESALAACTAGSPTACSPAPVAAMFCWADLAEDCLHA